jgi:hypothetical protein
VTSSDEEYLNWAPKRRIPLPSEAADGYILVRVRDFQRLRRRIDEELTPHHENISAAYFTLFGAAVATGVAVPSLLTASDLPNWLIPTFIVSATAFLLLGFVLALMAYNLKRGKRRTASEIAQEMREIEESSRGKKTASRLAGGKSGDCPKAIRS